MARRTSEVVPNKLGGTDVARQDVINEMWQLYCRGWNQFQLAERYGVSQPAISHHIKQIRKQLLAEGKRAREEILEEMEAGYRQVMREAWDAWERSKQDAEETKREKGDQVILKTGDLVPYEIETYTKTGRLPENEYLRTIVECWNQIRMMWGLDAPVKITGTVSVVTAELRDLLAAAEAQRECRAVEAKVHAVAGKETSADSHA